MERFHRVAERAVGRDEKEREIQHIRQVDQGGRKVLPLHAGRIRHDAKEDGDEGHDHRVPEIEGIFQRDFAVLHIEMKEEKEDRNRGKAEIHVPVAKEIPDRVHFTRLLSMTSAQKQRTLKPAGYIKKV